MLALVLSRRKKSRRNKSVLGLGRRCPDPRRGPKERKARTRPDFALPRRMRLGVASMRTLDHGFAAKSHLGALCLLGGFNQVSVRLLNWRCLEMSGSRIAADGLSPLRIGAGVLFFFHRAYALAHRRASRDIDGTRPRGGGVAGAQFTARIHKSSLLRNLLPASSTSDARATGDVCLCRAFLVAVGEARSCFGRER